MEAPQSQIQTKIAAPLNTFPKQTSISDKIFRWSIQNRNRIIFVFKLYYYLLVFLIVIGGYSAYRIDNNFLLFYDLGLWSGKIGLTFYVLTVIPGIARRFGLKHKLVAILMIFRRYTGIAMYLGVFAHFAIMRGAFYLRQMRIVWPMPLFELMGLSALILATFLFMTSNDYAVQHLKKWWNFIHKLTYIIIWLIALHVVLQGISAWSAVIGLTAIVQALSYVYSRFVSVPISKSRPQTPSDSIPATGV